MNEKNDTTFRVHCLQAQFLSDSDSFHSAPTLQPTLLLPLGVGLRRGITVDMLWHLVFQNFRTLWHLLRCFTLLAPLAEDMAEISVPADREKRWPGLGLVPEPGRRPGLPHGEAGGARRRTRRPRGSHLGKSGWRPGRCAGPSSHWGGCWPSPAGSTTWFGRRGRAEGRRQDASGSRRGVPGSGTHRGSAPGSAAAVPKGTVALPVPPRRSPYAGERLQGGHRTPAGRTLGSGPCLDPPCLWRVGRGRGQTRACGGAGPPSAEWKSRRRGMPGSARQLGHCTPALLAGAPGALQRRPPAPFFRCARPGRHAGGAGRANRRGGEMPEAVELKGRGRNESATAGSCTSERELEAGRAERRGER